MTKKDSKTVRYHFTAPAADTQIAEWAKHQHSLSISIRLVLKDFIARHGLIDVSCLPIMPLTNDCPQTVESVPENITQEEVSKPVAESVVTETKAEPTVSNAAPVAAPVTATPAPVSAPETESTNTKASSMLDDLMM